jgi:hypothetical protein
VHIEYQISQKDYVSAATLLLRRRSGLTAWRFYWPYVFATFWIASIVIPIHVGKYHRNAADPVFLFGILPAVIAIMWVRRFWLGQEYRRCTNLHLPHALEADEDSLRIVSEYSDCRMRWKVYSKFLENPRVFVLFHRGSQVFTMISKGGMTPAQVVELRTLLRAQITRQASGAGRRR